MANEWEIDVTKFKNILCKLNGHTTTVLQELITAGLSPLTARGMIARQLIMLSRTSQLSETYYGCYFDTFFSVLTSGSPIFNNTVDDLQSNTQPRKVIPRQPKKLIPKNVIEKDDPETKKINDEVSGLMKLYIGKQITNNRGRKVTWKIVEENGEYTFFIERLDFPGLTKSISMQDLRKPGKWRISTPTVEEQKSDEETKEI